MARPLRVLFVSRPGTGGAARHLLLLVRLLDRGRFEPTCAVSPLEDPRYPEALTALGARVLRVSMQRDPSPLRDLAAFHAIRRLVRSGEYDLVHAHTAKPGVFARLAAHRAGVPVIYTPHGWYFSYAAGAAARALYLRVERRLAPRAALIHCVGEEEAATAVREGVCDPGRLRVIPNAVPAPPPDVAGRGAAVRAALGIAPGRAVALMAARLAEPKDPLRFLAAAARVGPRTGALFVLAGGGPLLDACRAAAGPHALVLGDRSDVPDLLAAADVAVLCTRYEACPTFLLEAAAAGRPVVAPSAFVPRDLLPGAVAFGEGDGALDDALLGLLAPEAGPRRAALGAEGRAAWSLSYAPERWIRAMEDMYREAMEARPIP